MITEADYQMFLTNIFDHEEKAEAWYWDLDAPNYYGNKDDDPSVTAQLIALTFRRSGTDLLRFTDRQVKDGLDYLLNPSCSNITFYIRDGEAPIDVKLDFMRSFRWLYSDCFARRCPPVLSYLNETSSSALNSTCYMLWDNMPFNGSWTKNIAKEASDEILNVLEFALYLPNDACIESALHGFGHIADSTNVLRHPEREIIIDRFLKQKPGLRKELIEYARHAAKGNVQ
jgi:hypothetical protein